MEITINTQQIVDSIEESFLFDDIKIAGRFTCEVLNLLYGINSKFADSVNKAYRETEGYKKAISEVDKKYKMKYGSN